MADDEIVPVSAWVTVAQAEALRVKTGATEQGIQRATIEIEKITRYEPEDIEWLQDRPYGAEEIKNLRRAAAALAFALGGSSSEATVLDLEQQFGGRRVSSLAQFGMSVSFEKDSASTATNPDLIDAIYYLRRLVRLRDPSQESSGQCGQCNDEFLTPELIQARLHQAYMYSADPNRPFRRSQWLR